MWCFGGGAVVFFRAVENSLSVVGSGMMVTSMSKGLNEMLGC